MLRCADGSYYVESARNNDLGQRVAEHEAGEYQGYTSTRRPVRLVWSEHFDRITDAIEAERKIKGWGRAKKEALIKGNWTEIKRLARRRAGWRLEIRRAPLLLILRWPRSGPRRMQAPPPRPRPSRLAALAPQGEDVGGARGGPSSKSVLDERMFECSFSFMKSSPVSLQSIWASIAAANFGVALSKEKLGISNLIS